MCFDVSNEIGQKIETRFCFVYQLSQRIITCFFSWNSGMTWRIMSAASSSFVFCFATYDNRVKPKARKFYPFSRPVRRASGWQNSVRSGRKNPCEQHDQTGRKHLQTLSRILALSYHLCKEIPAVYEGNPEPAGKPWTQWHSWTRSNPLSHGNRHNKRHWAISR